MNSYSAADFDKASKFVDSQHQLLIDGEWCAARAGRTLVTVNPADEVDLASFAFGGDEDIDLAVDSARRALEGEWSGLAHTERAEMLLGLAHLMERDAEILALIETLDMGKPVYEARQTDLPAAIAEIKDCAGWATKLFGDAFRLPNGSGHAFTVREPMGVAGLIVPWNYPLQVAVTKLAAALAAGCTTVLKPPEQAPLSCLYLGRLILEAGFPKGVVNIVTGDGSTGAALAAHEEVDKISFTGSTEVGRKIIAASAGNFKRVTLELGGKSPIIVFPDADLDQAVEAAAFGIFQTSGQVCGASSRLYAHEKVFDQVVEGVAQKARQLKVGPGLDPDTEMGPLVSAEQLAKVTGLIESGLSEGAEVVTGGDQIDRAGYFVEPTVLVRSKPEMRIMKEEIFGPVLASASFGEGDIDQVAAEANNSTYGLVAYLWTRDLGTAHKMASKLKAGCISINGGWADGLSIGGFKQSGWGREVGREGVEAYLQVKSVGIAY